MRRLLISIFVICVGCLSTTLAQSTARISIPKDFVVTFGEASNGEQSFYRISPDGRVSYFFYSNMPETPGFASLLGQKKPKLPTLRDKLSSRQIAQIISEIERSGFFTIGQSGCGENITSDGQALSITVRSNGTTKSLTKDGGCVPMSGSDAETFQTLYTKLGEYIKGIKPSRVGRDEFFGPN